MRKLSIRSFLMSAKYEGSTLLNFICSKRGEDVKERRESVFSNNLSIIEITLSPFFLATQ